MTGIITSRSPMRHLTRSKPSGLLSLDSASTRGFRYFSFSSDETRFLDKALYLDAVDSLVGIRHFAIIRLAI